MNSITTLLLRYSSEEFIKISVANSDYDKISYLINWISENNHGTILSTSSPYIIYCKKENDFIACRMKAKALGLIPLAKHK